MKAKLFLVAVVITSVFIAGISMAADPPKTDPPPKAATEEKKEAEKIDINSATLKALITLPGIGEVIAQRIIDARPYEKPEELIEKVKGIGEKTYEKIKDLIVAKSLKKEEKPVPTPTSKPKK